MQMIGHFLAKRNLYFIFSASPPFFSKNVPAPLSAFKNLAVHKNVKKPCGAHKLAY